MSKINRQYSLEKKKELFLKLQKENEIRPKEKIYPDGNKNKIPVSYVQKRTLDAVIDGLYDPDEIRSPGPTLGYILKGQINISALHKAINEIVRRHEVLRTNFKIIDKELCQAINEVTQNVLKVIDLNNLSEPEKENETNRIILKETSVSFGFFKDLLMIKFILLVKETKHILFITTHHIATDAWSMGILQNELFTLYKEFSENKPSPFPELPIQFSDYAIWERERFSGDFLERKLNYWKRLLSKKKTNLPTDYNPRIITYDGDMVPIFIGPELTREIKLLCKKHEVTIFLILLSAFISLIYCFSGYAYNLFSIPVSNRSRKETKSLIGCIMNFQYVLSNMEGNPGFLKIMERTNDALLEAFDNYIPSIFLSELIPPEEPLIDFQLNSFSEGIIKGTDVISDMEKDIDSASRGLDAGTASKDLDNGSVLKDNDIDKIPKELKMNEAFKDMKPESVFKNFKIENSTKNDEGFSVSKALETNTISKNMESNYKSNHPEIIPYSIPQPIFALFEMDVNLTETSGQINGALTYKTCIYNRATIVELVKEYIVLLRNIVNNPNLRISEMNIKSNRRLQE